MRMFCMNLLLLLLLLVLLLVLLLFCVLFSFARLHSLAHYLYTPHIKTIYFFFFFCYFICLSCLVTTHVHVMINNNKIINTHRKQLTLLSKLLTAEIMSNLFQIAPSPFYHRQLSMVDCCFLHAKFLHINHLQRRHFIFFFLTIRSTMTRALTDTGRCMCVGGHETVCCMLPAPECSGMMCAFVCVCCCCSYAYTLYVCLSLFLSMCVMFVHRVGECFSSRWQKAKVYMRPRVSVCVCVRAEALSLSACLYVSCALCIGMLDCFYWF